MLSVYKLMQIWYFICHKNKYGPRMNLKNGEKSFIAIFNIFRENSS